LFWVFFGAPKPVEEESHMRRFDGLRFDRTTEGSEGFEAKRRNPKGRTEGSLIDEARLFEGAKRQRKVEDGTLNFRKEIV
jgi:hypothetical protein